MFSGIVQELGTITANRIAGEGRLDIAAAAVLDGVRIGDSIAVNGCCLTVVAAGDGVFSADVMPETARLTTLAAARAGDRVNLEASLRFGERIGGHMVTGHIDAVGTMRELCDDGNAIWATVAAPHTLIATLVTKGCVAIDGISLTVVDVAADCFTVSLIPHTVAGTTAGRWRAGSTVNLEADLVAKYVANSVAQAVAGRLTTAGGAA